MTLPPILDPVQNQFAGEEVVSNYDYPTGYTPRALGNQLDTITGQLGVHSVEAEVYLEFLKAPLPPNAEGWFAIPAWQALAASYGEAVLKVFAALARPRNFRNYRVGQTGPEYLRQCEKTVAAWEKLRDEQKGRDILIVPAQFGLRHRGRSVRRAREVMNEREFGLGAFAVGVMLLTHPERLVQWEQLHVSCAGDEFAPGADGGFSHAPFFHFCGGRVGFSASWYGSDRELYGSASALL